MIPVNEPLMAKNTLKYVTDCIKTNWISSAGKYITTFEENFARFLGTKHAVTTTSGTTALHLALESLGIGPEDEVIVPDLTMIAVPYAVLYTGAKPVFIDVDPDIFNINPEKVREFLESQCEYNPKSKKTINKNTGRFVKAILPVHLYGHCCPMDDVSAIAEEFNLFIVEDAAEAHGALYYSQKNKGEAFYAGTMGDAGCFSFYANKIITTGEGGMMVTENDSIADKARRLKDLAHSTEKRFLHTELAFNYRMTNLQAAVGVSMLEEIDRFIGIKRKMAAAYDERLQDVEGLRLPEEKHWAKNVYWMYAVVVEEAFGKPRDMLMAALKEEGIDTRSFFIPAHRQFVFLRDWESFDQNFPVSNGLSEKGFYLPSGLALTEEQIDTVCAAVKKIRSKT
ncbi:MAG: DegT/DnrJ/EryC1/StrS family aminotransferase [Candidatus Aminicenantes bacterium]|nr:DegT/DnrJ/EryC1/StrS family aminotransferase [Candidatus Aminicenantes bacterium]